MHFDSDQWEKPRVDGKKKLKCSAVPLIFSHRSVKPTRKLPKKRLKSSSPSPVKRAKLIDVNDENDENSATQAYTNLAISGTLDPNENLKKQLLNQTKLIRKLRLKNNSNTKIIYKQNIKIATVTRKLKSFLNENQLSSLSVQNRRGFKWSNNTVQKALRLKFACGSVGYEELLAQHQPLPSLRTIRRKLQNISFQSGILDEVFKMMSIKIVSLNDKQTDCVLILDEMFLTEGLIYDVATKSFIGNVTLPDHEGVANHGLVFMLGGISSRWKQTVAYYFTSNSVNGHTLKPIMNNIILKAESIGLRVISVTSDMGASNKTMWTSYGINCSFGNNINNSIQHPYDPERKIFFLPDVPHVFKNIKQALINNKVIIIPNDIVEKNNLTSNTVDCKHIEALCTHQDDCELKLFHKLDLEDIKKPNHFDKMKVSKATNVINRDVSASLEYLVENEGYHQSYKTTAWFIKQVAKWFNLMTSRSPIIALSKFKEEKYKETLQFLQEFMDLFKNITIGCKGKWKPCQTGVLLATQSILDLQNIFLNKKNYKFLLTSRFTQDCLENLFSSIRSIQPIPNALQFKCNLKLVCIAQYLKNVSKSSYEQDDREFLGDLLDFSQIPKKVDLQTDEKVDLYMVIDDYESQSEIILNNTEQNSLYNIGGNKSYL